MSSLIQKIENRIKNQQQIPDLIEKIDNIISDSPHILSKNELEQLKIEKIELEKKMIKPNLSFDKKFDNFFYSFEDLDNTSEVQWLISGVIPSSTIGVFYGASGTIVNSTRATSNNLIGYGGVNFTRLIRRVLVS